MGLKVSIFLIFLLFLLPVTYAQIDVSYDGTCKDYIFQIKGDQEGCWDVKIDSPGIIQHEDGWKSSFFYLNEYLCDEETVEVQTRLSNNENVNGVVKLRQNDVILTHEFSISQTCPQGLGEEMFLAFAALIMAVLFLLISWYVNR